MMSKPDSLKSGEYEALPAVGQQASLQKQRIGSNRTLRGSQASLLGLELPANIPGADKAGRMPPRTDDSLETFKTNKRNHSVEGSLLRMQDSK